jgi:hypothetical protein
MDNNQAKEMLNANGYGFHFAVIEKLKSLYAQRRTKWAFESSEHPVCCNGNDTHIDMLFSMTETSHQSFLVGECKRSKLDWIFAPAPFTRRRNFRTPYISLDLVSWNGTAANCKYKHCPVEESVAHVGLATPFVRQGAKPKPGDPKDINDAVSQVIRGTSGLMNYLFIENKLKESTVPSSLFVPAVFTTAKLYLVDCELNKADLLTGDVGNLQVREVPWLWFVHNRSFSLRHGICQERPDSLSRMLTELHSRGVAIVNANGIEEFAKHDFYEMYV